MRLAEKKDILTALYGDKGVVENYSVLEALTVLSYNRDVDAYKMRLSKI